MNRRLIRCAGCALAVVMVLGGTFLRPSDSSAQTTTANSNQASVQLPPGYAQRVNYALSQKTDYWGEQLMAKPNGPTLKDVRRLLVPVNVAGKRLTASGWYYLPLTMPRPDPLRWEQQRDFTLHVADGSQILSQSAAPAVSLHSFASCTGSPQCVTFFVGQQGQEVYGSARNRLAPPRLAQNWLPILENSYVGASGVHYSRESFAMRIPQTHALVSFVHFTVTPSANSAKSADLRVGLQVPGVTGIRMQGNRLVHDGNTYIVFSNGAAWNASSLSYRLDLSHGPKNIYLIIWNQASPSASVQANAGTYRAARAKAISYWKHQIQRPTQIHVPEKYVEDAMKSTLLQNLVLAWQLSVGNTYEKTTPGSAYIPEGTSSVTMLGEFGFLHDYRGNLQALLTRGQGPSYFPDWEEGLKLESAAHYYLLSGDKSYVLDNLPTFVSYLHNLQAQRAADPYGLLQKERSASDIATKIYGLHSQADVWQGLRDMGLALGLIGKKQLAGQFLSEAQGFKNSLESAISKSEQKLPDGSLYVPISLLDPRAPAAFDFISATRTGSYWNLLAPYAFATGIFKPGSAKAKAILHYLYNHGSLFLGQVRFNYTGTKVGECKTGFPQGIDGYKSPGIDEQYGYSLLQFLSANNQANRIDLSLYGTLGADMTPFTYVTGEGVTIGPCPQLGEYYRTTWNPPLGSNNASFLEALRLTLVKESLNSRGLPNGLFLAPATPRPWLESGKNISVRDFPTLFGPVSYSITSHLSKGYVMAHIQPPKKGSGRVLPRDVTLRLRVPAGYAISSVRVDGHQYPFDASSQSIHLGPVRHSVTVRAYYRHK